MAEILLTTLSNWKIFNYCQKTHGPLLLIAVYTEIGLKKMWAFKNIYDLSENYFCLFFFVKAGVPWFKTNTKIKKNDYMWLVILSKGAE